jgi:hypothetical protein
MKTKYILEKFDTLNQTLERMADVLEKPEGSFQNISSIVGIAAAIAGMVEAINSFMSWFD